MTETIESIDRLMSVDARELVDDELRAHIVLMERERSRMDAVLSTALARLDATRAFEADAAVTAKSWLKYHTHMTGPQAAGRLRIARLLQRHQLIFDALLAGDITFDQVRMMFARCNPMTEQAFRDDQASLIDAARSVHIDDLPRVLDVWAAHADPNGADPGDPSVDSVHLNQGLDGRHHLQGNLNSADGDLLGRALEQADKQLGAMLDEHGQPLDPATRRAHGLADIARHYLGCGNSPTPVRPHVTILTNPTDLSLGLSAQTERGTWITGDHVRRFLCDATLQAALTDEDGNLLKRYGTSAFPDPALRRSIFARDRRCQFPGCDRQCHQCEIHHLKPRSEGGQTTPENCAACCDRHHHLIHKHRWTAYRETDGTIAVVDRFGCPIGPRSRWNSN